MDEVDAPSESGSHSVGAANLVKQEAAGAAVAISKEQVQDGEEQMEDVDQIPFMLE